jgi:hypothetical protein
LPVLVWKTSGLVGAVLLRWEAVGEQVRRRLAVGPGESEVVAGVTTEAAGDCNEEDRSDDPRAEDDPPPADGEHPQPMKNLSRAFAKCGLATVRRPASLIRLQKAV